MSSLAGGGVLNQVRHADGAKERAHRARRDIAALAAAGLGVSELHTAAIRPDRRSRQREANLLGCHRSGNARDQHHLRGGGVRYV
jgi:hypothetical protein